MQLIQGAVQLVPALADYEITETWAGFRPTAPDLLPILGKTMYQNVSIATGHHRNGILLIPATAQIMASVILNEKQQSPLFETLLPHFSFERFFGAPGSTVGAASPISTANVTPPVTTPPQAPAFVVGSPSARSSNAPLQSTPVSTPATQSTTPGPQIKLWHVLPDGKKEPIPYKKPPSCFASGYGDTAPKEEAWDPSRIDPTADVPGGARPRGTTSTPTSVPTPSELAAASPASGDAYDDITSAAESDRLRNAFEANRDVVRNTFESRQMAPTLETQNGAVASTSGKERNAVSDDAYDDVIAHGGVDADRKMSEHLRANRNFGRGLITPEERALFDRAWEVGFVDVQETSESASAIAAPPEPVTTPSANGSAAPTMVPVPSATHEDAALEDAYDDVIAHGGRDEDQKMSEHLAANRNFGGDLISPEERALFDRAFEEGLVEP